MKDLFWSVKFVCATFAIVFFFLSLPIIASVLPMPWELFGK